MVVRIRLTNALFLGHFYLQGLDVLFHLLVRLFFMRFNFLPPRSKHRSTFQIGKYYNQP